MSICVICGNIFLPRNRGFDEVYARIFDLIIHLYFIREFAADKLLSQFFCKISEICKDNFREKIERIPADFTDRADELCEGRILFVNSWRFFVDVNPRDLRHLREYFFCHEIEDSTKSMCE